MSTHFTGPIFVVGMPRSGTKLLRELLNNHPAIAIPSHESHFIPQLYSTLGQYGDLCKKDCFNRFFNDISQTIFYERLAAKNLAVSRIEWYEGIRDWSCAGVIETFYRIYAQKQGASIWGDKTPTYLLHIPLLYKMYPKARFIHIIRDARDYSLSMQKTWHKNIYRAAQRWVDSIRIARQNAESIPAQNYIEVKYEQLLQDPAAILNSLCGFLNITYEPGMLRLDKESEAHGDARGHPGVLKTNFNKWKDQFSAKQINKLEQISGELLAKLEYEVSCDTDNRSLGKWEMRLFQAFDGINVLRSDIRELGAFGAIRYFVRYQQHRRYLHPARDRSNTTPAE